jgi:hypothetical protein
MQAAKYRKALQDVFFEAFDSSIPVSFQGEDVLAGGKD